MNDKYVGKRIDGRYEIHGLIGTGGMSYVYKAYDTETKNWVAVKILKEELSDNTEFLRRFRNESRAIAMLSHPNIVKVVDVSFGDKIQYIVMEYIDGITLKDYITGKGIISWKDTLFFTVQILKALQHAHSKGIIHRDVKPQNIILLKNGTIKVTDFGIARFLQSETQTMTGKALGSVHYIAPEQARGDLTSEKTDLYSLGVLMYEMLTGELPFDAESAVSVALMQLQDEPEMPRVINPAIPVGLEDITMRAMQKKPEDRFANTSEMLKDIDLFRQNPNISFGYQYGKDLEPTKQIDVNEMNISNNNRNYEDDYEYEEELVKSKIHARSSMVLTGVISAAVIIVIVLAVFFVRDFLAQSAEEPDDEILLPDFVGQMYDENIYANTEYDDFEFEIVEIRDDSKEYGLIIRQNPNGGIMVKEGRVVTLYVNSDGGEREPVNIPDVTGQDQTDAFNMIKTAGFIPVVQSISDDDVEEKKVIKTEPAANTMLEGGSEVIIYVSKGPAEQPVEVPSVIGETLAEATDLLELSELEVGTTTYDDESEEPKDTVIDATPGEGETAEKGSKVDLVLSSGKNADKDVNAIVSLPTDVNEDLHVEIYVNGSVIQTATVNPLYQGTYTFTVTGKTGTQSVVVELDNQEYLKGTINYDEQTFTVDTIIPYTPAATPTPEPTPTPAPTPEPTPVPPVTPPESSEETPTT